MEIKELHAWPSTPEDAEAIQDRLKPLMIDCPGPQKLTTVAGLDVAYADDRLAAAVVVLDATTFEVLAEATAVDQPTFPYIPGLFAFRELPALVAALRKIELIPDLLVCDGHGLAHPRGFGLACHLGILTGLPTIGVGKTHLIGSYEPVGSARGSYSPLLHENRTVGRVVRTQQDVKPVYVSVGHRIDLDTATRHLLDLTPRYRLPETTRQSDQLSRRALRALVRLRLTPATGGAVPRPHGERDGEGDNPRPMGNPGHRGMSGPPHGTQPPGRHRPISQSGHCRSTFRRTCVPTDIPPGVS